MLRKAYSNRITITKNKTLLAWLKKKNKCRTFSLQWTRKNHSDWFRKNTSSYPMGTTVALRKTKWVALENLRAWAELKCRTLGCDSYQVGKQLIAPHKETERFHLNRPEKNTRRQDSQKTRRGTQNARIVCSGATNGHGFQKLWRKQLLVQNNRRQLIPAPRDKSPRILSAQLKLYFITHQSEVAYLTGCEQISAEKLFSSCDSR